MACCGWVGSGWGSASACATARLELRLGSIQSPPLGTDSTNENRSGGELPETHRRRRSGGIVVDATGVPGVFGGVGHGGGCGSTRWGPSFPRPPSSMSIAMAAGASALRYDAVAEIPWRRRRMCGGGASRLGFRGGDAARTSRGGF